MPITTPSDRLRSPWERFQRARASQSSASFVGTFEAEVCKLLRRLVNAAGHAAGHAAEHTAEHTAEHKSSYHRCPSSDPPDAATPLIRSRAVATARCAHSGSPRCAGHYTASAPPSLAPVPPSLAGGALPPAPAMPPPPPRAASPPEFQGAAANGRCTSAALSSRRLTETAVQTMPICGRRETKSHPACGRLMGCRWPPTVC